MASIREELKDILSEAPYIEIMYSIDEAVDYLIDNGVTVNKGHKHHSTADVVEVVHGEWDSNGDFYNCSVCNNYAGYDYDYCPYCGAKMDGRRDT